MKHSFEERIKESIAAYLPQMIALSDTLADSPELSGQEFTACRTITELLRQHDFAVETPFIGLPTAFKGVHGPDSHTHKVAILAEYDALAELGHACGHCVSGAISVCAAIALAPLQDALDTDVHIIGTPGEELLSYKCHMVDKGVFDGYDAAMMLHLGNKNLVTCKLFALRTLSYTFHGKAAHAAAAPWEGRNALNGVQLFFHAIDMLRQHTLPDTKMHGYIKNGGCAPNIIPDTAIADLYLRSSHAAYLDELYRLAGDCAAGAALATQTTWEDHSLTPTLFDLLPNPSGTALLAHQYEKLGIPIDDDEGMFFGSSDIGNVSFACPTFHPTLKITSDNAALHTQAFANCVKTEKAHHAIADGAAVLANFVAELFSDPQKITQLKQDFQEMLQIRGYSI